MLKTNAIQIYGEIWYYAKQSTIEATILLIALMSLRIQLHVYQIVTRKPKNSDPLKKFGNGFF